MRRLSPRAVSILIAFVIPVLAEAASRIAVGPIRGDEKAVLAKQLALELCGNYKCVPPSLVFTNKKPDLKKAREQNVAGILTGAVAKKESGRVLSLVLLTKPTRSVQTWSFPLTRRGTLSPKHARQVADGLDVQIGFAAPVAAAAPAPLARPAPEKLPEPAPVAAAPAAAPEPKPVEKSPPPARATASDSGRKKQPVVAIEAGAYLTNRKLSYKGSNTGTSTLSTYTASMIFSPAFRLELFPVSLVTDGIFSSIGLFGDYSLAMGLKTQQEGTSEKRNTKFMRLQGGLMWRIPISSSGIALIPAVSYQQLKFTVTPSFASLPNSSLSGFKGALNLEVPLGSSFALLAGGGYVIWSTAKDLIKGGTSFFPGGSAHALEAEVGLSVAVFGPISVRVLGEYSSTSYSLNSDPSGTYVATGATDQYLGGRAMVRGQF